MAARTRARLPHRVPPIPPMRALLNCAWWETSEYYVASAYKEFGGNTEFLGLTEDRRVHGK